MTNDKYKLNKEEQYIEDHLEEYIDVTTPQMLEDLKEAATRTLELRKAGITADEFILNEPKSEYKTEKLKDNPKK